ncbi:TonB-dependent receptor [Flammeovirga sp. SubArs3]|uniref:TonB-dependent receptor n=1 Tax=Flammeovirga sp. SubArs3 TaxID=2995316 RepID=UPI00248CD772|nr:TonB-dependent receptor [Flammeovirga sp. SubArs3]
MTYFKLTLLLALSPLLIFAQQNISGSVKDTEGNTLPNVSVGILHTTISQSTAEDGTFTLENIPVGEHQLVAHFVGYEKASVTINVTENAQLQHHFILKENTRELQQVEILGVEDQSYNNEYTFSATRTGTLIKDVPQSISTVTKELILDQQAYYLGDVVRNVAGVSQYTIYNDYTVRGYRNQDGQLVNGLKTAFNFWTQPIIGLYERVEVIKGPASALFANASPGGTINFVTKKPLTTTQGSASISGGSFNTYKANVDITGPLTKNEKLLYRFNTGYQTTDTFRDNSGGESFYVAPSLSFVPSDKTRFNVDMVYMKNNTVLDRGKPNYEGSTDLSETPINLSTSQPGDHLNNDNLYITFSWNQKINDWLSFNSSYLMFRSQSDLAEHRTNGKYISPSVLEMRYVERDEYENSDNITNYFVSKFNTGKVKHTLMFGMDYSAKVYDKYEKQARGEAQGVPNFDLDNPQYGNSNPNDYDFDPKRTIEKGTTAYTKNHTTGIYLQEQLQYKKLNVLLGVRQEFYKDIRVENGQQVAKDQTAFLPRLGLTYEITKTINAFGTYTEGFEPQDFGLNAEQNGGPFDPKKSNMWETGLKGDFFDGRLSATTSVYWITVNNILVQDPNDIDKLIQRGQEQSKGFEFEVNGQVTKNLSLTVNYAYNDAVITESDNPAEIGRQKENAPKNQAGFWAKYDFSQGTLKGLGLGFGGQYVGDRLTNTEGLVLDAYMLWDMAVYYNIGKFRISANLKNLTDETYYVGGYSYDRVFPGAPRNYTIGLNYTF